MVTLATIHGMVHRAQSFFVDPKEQMVVVMMGVAPGEVRKIHREKLNALIYGALDK